MRVALVNPDLHPSSGGPAENVPRLADALAGQGMDVELHAVGEVPPSRGNPRFVGAAPAAPRRIGRSPELLANLLRCQPDVIHANCLWMLPLGYAARAARAHGKPLVISPRGMLAPWALGRSRWKKALAGRLLHPGAFSRAAGWHATSEQEAGQIRALGLHQPICMAPNGIEPPLEDQALVRERYLALAPEIAGKRVLLFYSRFHSKKRIVELLADFAAVARERPEWHLLAVGLAEEFSVPQLRGEAARLGLSGRATILDGHALPKPYAVAELFALPTHEENFGRVVAEALAAGVPVITTTGTPWGHLNAIDAGGWVPLSSFRQDLCGLMIRSPSDLRAAGERGKVWVLETMSWSGAAMRLKRFYEALLGRG